MKCLVCDREVRSSWMLSTECCYDCYNVYRKGRPHTMKWVETPMRAEEKREFIASRVKGVGKLAGNGPLRR